MLKLPPLSLYIHIPWCIKKCPYCDFNSHQQKGELPEQTYINQLLLDLTKDWDEVVQRPIETIFIGGGTPSLLSVSAIERLLSALRNQLPLRPHLEITLEANPGAIEQERFVGYRASGINRFSIGIQSFHAEYLSALGRIHTPQAALNAAHMALSLPATRINLDLMHGLPQQTVAQALKDLQQAIALAPTHLSWYQLTLEPYTEFAAKPPPLPDEEQLWQIWQQGDQLLEHAGYQRYETSAYARFGDYSQHNLNYWRFGDYIGIGCGAHGKISFPDGRILRTAKTQHPLGYLQGNHRQKQWIVPKEQRSLEFFMNRWRLVEPTPRHEFSELTGLQESQIRQPLDQLLKKGYLQETADSWIVTSQGQLFLNEMLTLF
ncbi:MAG: radical SAM family heme chaperone HemW [Candidatus Symbiodolus clandestinus]